MKRLLLAFALFACDRDKKVIAAADAAALVDAAPVVAAPTVDAAPLAPLVDACGADAPIESAKSIGHTSVVYKITLADGRKLAWKPNAKKVKNRWRGEVAAYRLGLALGIPNVPPACERSYPRAAVAGKVDVAELMGEPIQGAVVPWIEGLQFMALEKEPLRGQTAKWLTAKTPLPTGDEAALAAQLSTLVVFDAITGNWDRYSGGNVGLDASGKTVLFIDNDAAFMEGPPKEALNAAQARLEATDRFSRSVVTRLQGLDEIALRGVFNPDFFPAPILADVVLRVQMVQKTVATKIAARSEADVLPFP